LNKGRCDEMTSEFELYVQQQLSAIMKRLDEMESKMDRIFASGQIKQDSSRTSSTEVNRISQVVQAKLSNALARKRAKAVNEMNENL